ncbi:hypothetical protein GCM10009678_74600 [Actinomadura kijaniata]
MSQMLGPRPSAVTDPSTWYAAVAAPQTKPGGKSFLLVTLAPSWAVTAIGDPRSSDVGGGVAHTAPEAVCEEHLDTAKVVIRAGSATSPLARSACPIAIRPEPHQHFHDVPGVLGARQLEVT